MSLCRIRGLRASGRTSALPAPPLALLVLALALCLPASSAAAQTAPPGFFGVDASSSEAADFAGMAAADVGVTRAVFPFQVLRQGPDEPYFWGYSDHLVKVTANNGMDLIPTLYGAPPWISEELNKTPLHGESRRAWGQLLIETVGRYGPGGEFWALNPAVPYRPIGTWQIWNEPNSVTWWGPRPRPLEYATLLRRSERAIHYVDPNALILSAGIVARPTNNNKIPGTTFMSKLFAARGIAEIVDAVAYHPFAPSVAGVRRQLRDARVVLRDHGAGQTPLWITEIGWGSAGPRGHPLIKSARGQNRALRDTFEMVLAERERLGIARLLWYQWKDGGDDLCLWCETSGLVDRASAPKLLLETFRQIATR